MNCFRRRFAVSVMVHVSTLSWMLFSSPMAVKASVPQDGMPSDSTQASSLIQRIRTGELITLCRPKPVSELPETHTEIASMSYDTVSTVSHYKKKHSDHEHHWILVDQSTTAPVGLPNHDDMIEIAGSYHGKHSKGKGDKSKGHHHNKSPKDKGDKSAGHHHKGSKEKGGKSSGKHGEKSSKGKKDKSTGHYHKKSSKENSGKSAKHHHHKGGKKGGKSTGHYHKKSSKDSKSLKVKGGSKYSKSSFGKYHKHKHLKHSKEHGEKSSGKKSKLKSSKKCGKSKGSKGCTKGKGGKTKCLKGKHGKSKCVKGKHGKYKCSKGKGGKSKYSKGKGGKSKYSKEKSEKSKHSKGKSEKSKHSKGKGGKSKLSKGKSEKSKHSKGKGEKSKGHSWFVIQEDNVLPCDAGSLPCHEPPNIVVSDHEDSPDKHSSDIPHVPDVVKSGSDSTETDVTSTEDKSYIYGYKVSIGAHNKSKKNSPTNNHVTLVTGVDVENLPSKVHGSTKGKGNQKDSAATKTGKSKKSEGLSYNYGLKSVPSSHNKNEKLSVVSVTNSDDVISIAKGSLDYGSSAAQKTSKPKSSIELTSSDSKSSTKGSTLSFNYGYKNGISSHKHVVTSTTVVSSGNHVTNIAKGSPLSYDYGVSKGQSNEKDSEDSGSSEVTSSINKSSTKGSSLSFDYGYKSTTSSHKHVVTSATSVSSRDYVMDVAKGSPLSYDYAVNKGQSDKKDSKDNGSSEMNSSINKSSTKGSSLSFNYGYKSVTSSHKHQATSITLASNAKGVSSTAKGSSLSYDYGINKGLSNKKDSKVASTKERSDSLNEAPSKGGSLSYKYGRRREQATKKFVHLTTTSDFEKLSSRTGSFMSAFGTDYAGQYNRKRVLSDKTSNGEYCSRDSLPIEIMCKNSAHTTDFELNIVYKVEITSTLPSTSDLAKVEADMLSSAAQTISCVQNCGCIIAGVSSSSSPAVKGGCDSYEGSNYCFEVKDTMTIHLVHLDGVPIEKDDISNAAGKVTSNVKADAKAGSYNHGSIIKVKILSTSADETYTFRNEVESVPIQIPQSSTEGLASAKEARSSTGFIVGLALLCVGVFAALFFAVLKKKTQKGERELDDLAQAYYDGDDHFSKLGPWDVLSLSSDGRTLTSSVIDPSLNPAETSKNVHICSSAMCTECSTRKNRSQRVQFIPCVEEKRSETNHDDEEKSF